MEVVIIGGGVAGCGEALALANQGHQVILIDAREDLLLGSSDDTPCRLGLGFHYIDIPTAIKYFHASLALAKKYPEFVLGHDLPDDHAYKRGRYFVRHDSVFRLTKIDALHEKLYDEYQRLVDQDPANEVFGDPKFFTQALTPDQWGKNVDKGKFIMGYETAERTLNWPLLQDHLRKQIHDHPNITVRCNTRVLDITSEMLHPDETVLPHDNPPTAQTASTSDNKHQYYTLTTERLVNGNENSADSGDEENRQTVCETLSSRHVVNAAWEATKELSQKRGYHLSRKERTLRTKCMVEVRLPPDFETTTASAESDYQQGQVPDQTSSPEHSMFMCFGPHCSFTNLGNGQGFVTAERITNVEATTGLTLEPLSQALMWGHVPLEQTIETYGKPILEAASENIPGLKGSEIQAVKFGVVLTEGKTSLDDLNDPNNPIHQRREYGTAGGEVGFRRNNAMKLVYFAKNAELASEQLKQDQELLAYLDQVQIYHDDADIKYDVIHDALITHLKGSVHDAVYNRHTPLSPEEYASQIHQTIDDKRTLLTELLQAPPTLSPPRRRNADEEPASEQDKLSSGGARTTLATYSAATDGVDWQKTPPVESPARLLAAAQQSFHSSHRSPSPTRRLRRKTTPNSADLHTDETHELFMAKRATSTANQQGYLAYPSSPVHQQSSGRRPRSCPPPSTNQAQTTVANGHTSPRMTPDGRAISVP